jgi:ethanolamine utilization microcompartment shell protein EutS
MAKFVQTTLIDGYAGGPHVTEVQLGLAHQATFGPDDYVLEGGRKSEAQVLTNNSIRIFDAVYCIQGRRDVIPASGYTDVTIANGTQGMNRNDIIVRRYKKDESSEIESTEYAVIKGTPNAGEAVDPEVTIGDIRTGATLHEMKLYRVKIKGLNITAVEPLFNILKNMAALQQEIAQANKDLTEKLGFQMLLNTDAQQIYTMYGGRVKVVSGTKIIDVSRNIGYVRAFSGEELKALFGDSFNATRLTVTTYNGDDVAQETHFYEPEIWKGEIFQYFYPISIEGKMRINYKMEYVYG